MPRIINICMGILGAAIVLLSSLLFTNAIQAPENATPLSDISATGIEEDKYYLVTMCIIDCYAYSGTKETDNCIYDYYVMFEDKDQKAYSASLSVPVTAPISKALQNYYGNEDMMIGDCVIDCYVKADKIGFTDSTAIEFYTDTIEYYKDIITVEDELEIAFEYFCGATESYTATRKAEASSKAMLFMAFTVIGAIIIIVAFAIPSVQTANNIPKPLKQENEAYSNVYIEPADNTADANSPETAEAASANEKEG